MQYFIKLITIFLYLCVFSVQAETAAVAIIIDDIGHNLEAGKRVINSRWPITCSILPARPHSIALAQLAYRNDKEVMVHIPMQARKSHVLGHGALTSTMSRGEFIRTVNVSIDAVPYARGINNHMGSLLTKDQTRMELLMQTIANRDDYLYFVDSKTIGGTVANHIANEYHIPSLARDIFLDTKDNSEDFVKQQILQLIKIAKRKGYALAIGHPNLVTISILEQELSKFNALEIELVSVSKLIQIATSKKLARKSNKQWQTYSSLSPQVVKN